MPPLYLFIPDTESNKVCPGSSDFRVGFSWKASEYKRSNKNDVARLKQWLAASAGGNFVDSHCWVTWERGNK